MSINEVKALVFQGLTFSRHTRIVYLSMADEYDRNICIDSYLYIYLSFMILPQKIRDVSQTFLIEKFQEYI